LSVKFYKKSVAICDYIAFILPISQLNNNQQMYEFDLIYSEDLGKQAYSDRIVHCCFNIYKRPSVLNSKPNYKLKDVEIIEVRNANKKVPDADLKICAWGSIGKTIEEESLHAKVFCFKIHNKKYKNEVLKIIQETDWCELYPMTTTPNLLQWQVYKYLKEKIPELT
jgi:hypothetical protein